MSLAREALIEFGSVFRFEDLDGACLRILNAAQRDLSRLARHGISQDELDQVLAQRDRTADAYASFVGEGRREEVLQPDTAERWAKEDWSLEQAAGSLAYDPSSGEAAPTSEAREGLLPDEASSLREASGLEESASARLRGGARTAAFGDEPLTVVTPREPPDAEALSGADLLSFEKGILYGLLRRVCRLARLEFDSDKERSGTYSLPQPRENLTSITLH
jgi:hypothetical protein